MGEFASMITLASLHPWKGAICGSAAFLLGLTPAPLDCYCRAADPLTVQLPEQTPRDWVLTSAAKRALQNDEQLVRLSLGVSVNNKVATIWGTLPSKEMGTRAEETLKKIKGIAAVINECRIVAVDPVPQAVADAVNKARHQGDDPDTSAKQSFPPPLAPTSRVVAKPGYDGLPLKPNGDPPAIDPGAPNVTSPRAAVLLSPVASDGVDAPPTKLSEWESARRSEIRFKDVSLVAQNGIVKINGVVPQMKDAWDLAEKLNNLAGVKQVILGDVTER
jgi:BON domain